MKNANILFLVLGLSLLFFGCTGGETKTTDSDVVKDTAKKTAYANALDQFKSKDPNYTYYSSPMFLIYYPKGWHADDSQNPVFHFISPQENTNDTVLEEFIVEIWAGNESTAADFEASERKLMVEGDTVTKKESLQYKGKDAFSIVIEGNHPDTGVPMLYKTVFFRNGKWVYRLNYGIEKSKLDKYQPTTESIFDKFVIGSG